MPVYDIQHYKTASGKDVYMDWWKKLRDYKARSAIDRRLYRAQLGNFGDHKYLQGGVSELRIDVGPGYRIYYAIEGQRIILLLCAGDKSTQRSDIERACDLWRDLQDRMAKGGKLDE